MIMKFVENYHPQMASWWHVFVPKNEIKKLKMLLHAFLESVMLFRKAAPTQRLLTYPKVQNAI